METILFPFTFIADSEAQAITDAFGPISVYQPSGLPPAAAMQPWIEKGLIRLRVPVTDDEAVLSKIVSDFQNWGDFHQKGAGLRAAGFKAPDFVAPFFDPTSVARIRSQIRAYQQDKSETEPAAPILRARIFLHMAQAFDVQSLEVAHAFESVQTCEADLFGALKGGDGGEFVNGRPRPARKVPDLGSHMALERLAAWGLLFLKDLPLLGSGPFFFVTPSRMIWEGLREKLEDLKEVLVLEPETVPKMEADKWRQAFGAYIESLSSGSLPDAPSDIPPPSGCPVGMKLTIALVPDTPPEALFTGLAGQDSAHAGDASGPPAQRNSLLGLAEVG